VELLMNARLKWRTSIARGAEKTEGTSDRSDTKWYSVHTYTSQTCMLSHYSSPPLLISQPSKRQRSNPINPQTPIANTNPIIAPCARLYPSLLVGRTHPLCTYDQHATPVEDAVCACLPKRCGRIGLARYAAVVGSAGAYNGEVGIPVDNTRSTAEGLPVDLGCDVVGGASGIDGCLGRGYLNEG
jgi:hypothetical protein